MLTQIDIFNLKFYSPELTLATPGEASTDPIQILNITGLGPVKAAINTMQYVELHGESLSSINIGKRNIVITVGLNPDWEDQTIDSLRTMLYSYFLPRSSVRLRFTSTHLPTCEIDGYIESMEEDRFSKDPQMAVSILCLNPDFVSTTPTIITGDVVAMGSSIMTTVPYTGSVESGFEVVLSQPGGGNSEVTKGTVMLTTSPVSSAFILSENHNSDWNVIITTLLGQKNVRAVGVGVSNMGVTGSLLPGVDNESEWPVLYPGDNEFAVMTGSSNLTNSEWALTYFARYGGL